MALIRPNALEPVRATNNGESLLVVSGHDGVELGATDPQGGQEVVDKHPTGRIRREAKPYRVMPQRT
jgi:hypothetical protein